MKKRFGRSRGLLAIVALAVVAVMCSVSTAYAASAGAPGGAGIGPAAASRSMAASGTPCSFVPALTCESTDPAVALNIYYYGDTSACTFV